MNEPRLRYLACSFRVKDSLIGVVHLQPLILFLVGVLSKLEPRKVAAEADGDDSRRPRRLSSPVELLPQIAALGGREDLCINVSFKGDDLLTSVADLLLHIIVNWSRETGI